MLKSAIINILLLLFCLQLANSQFNNRKQEDDSSEGDYITPNTWGRLFNPDFFIPSIRSLIGKDDSDSAASDNIPSDDEMVNTKRDREPLIPNNKRKSETPSPDNEFDFGIVDIPAASGARRKYNKNKDDESKESEGGGDVSTSVDSFMGGFPSINKWAGNIFDVFSFVSRQKPWWKGPNVCIEREEMIETPDKDDESKEVSKTEDDNIGFFSNINFSTCTETPSKYECTTKSGTRGAMKTVIVKYRCCHGYQRLENENECIKVDLKDMMTTCNELAGKEFITMAQNTNLEKNLATENITVFVPTDQSLKDFSEKLLEMNEVEMAVPNERRKREVAKHALSSRELVLSHIVPRYVELNDLSNGDVLNSEYDNSTIRINVYPTPNDEHLITANCIPIVKRDKMATNGIVHVLEGVMMPVTRSIDEIIANNNKFTILNKILQTLDTKTILNDDNVYTLLAPTDAAFEKLKPDIREKLMKGDNCAKNIIKHHILSHSVCSNAITFNASTYDSEGVRISLRRDDTTNKLIVDNTANVVETDLMATNGIIHAIDTILIPESGLDSGELLEKHNLTEFKQLVEEAGLSEVINKLDNVTLIAPTNQAIKDADEQITEIKKDKNKLQELIMYHTIKGEIKSCDFNDDILLKSGLQEKQLRVNLYNTLPFFRSIYNRATINCARLISIDEQACNSVIHEISKVLIPPEQSVLDYLQNQPDYSTFIKLLKGTKLEEELLAANDSDSFTVLAPTNEAFDDLPKSQLTKLEEDKEKADEILRLHFIPEVVCCAGVGYQTFPFIEKVRTMGPYSLTQSHDGQNHVRFANSVVTKCDQITTNGVVHTVNKVIRPPRRQLNPLTNFNTMLLNI